MCGKELVEPLLISFNLDLTSIFYINLVVVAYFTVTSLNYEYLVLRCNSSHYSFIEEFELHEVI